MTRKMLIRILVLALMAVVVGAAVQAQGWKGRGRAQGRIVDDNGEPIEGVKITLTQPQSSAGPEPLYSDKNGKWGYLGLTGGTWSVVTELEGHVTAEGLLQVSEFGGAASVTVQLHKIPESVLQEEAATAAVSRLREGNDLLAQERYEEARAAYESALGDLEPQYHADILLNIARTHYQQDDTGAAIAALERVLAVAPDNLDALKLIISLLIAEEREDEVQAYMARLPEGESLDADAYLNVGIGAYNTGDYETALDQFNQVVENFPTNADGFYYRGLIYLAQQDTTQATADLQKYVELAPDGEHREEVDSFLEYLQSGQ
ncbi:MAG: tetratricopeptide repeat protein [Acidobacteria bacterium]|nr:tetratricopeptide repeat protein [Acidobacteriota bacterium]